MRRRQLQMRLPQRWSWRRSGGVKSANRAFATLSAANRFAKNSLSQGGDLYLKVSPMDLAQMARTVAGVAAAFPREDDLREEIKAAATAAERGYFTPDEDEIVRRSFSDYLSARAALHEMLAELRPDFVTAGVVQVDDNPKSKRAFVVAFLASAVLVRAATYMVDGYAQKKVIWRKLDEAEPRFGIPRKQFSKVYKSLTSPQNVWTFHWAMRRFDEMRDQLIDADSPEWFRRVFESAVSEFEWQSQKFSRRDHIVSRLRYWLHSIRRKKSSSWDQVLFSMLELGGRTVSEVHNPFHTKRVSSETVAKIGELLEPGDVFVTRHDDAMTNLFLPGFWPHAALHIGDRLQREKLGIDSTQMLETDVQGRSIRMLESQKDGVRFRALEETLEVDAFVVIRPTISAAALKASLERAMSHEGKLYDFNFDFTQADRMVCTEVIYRGFHQADGLEFELTERAGRMSFSAEDLLDHAVDGLGFDVIAIAGFSSDEILEGKAAREELIRSYRSGAS